MSELNEILEEIETAIKEYSEELVQQLALRDELEFEKEVKNSFISVLIEVQNKQKEHKETAKKKKKLKNGSSQNGKNERGHMPGTVSDVLQEASNAGNRFCGSLGLPGWWQVRQVVHGQECCTSNQSPGGFYSRIPLCSVSSESRFLD